jgi:hypothetical protein
MLLAGTIGIAVGMAFAFVNALNAWKAHNFPHSILAIELAVSYDEPFAKPLEHSFR